MSYLFLSGNLLYDDINTDAAGFRDVTNVNNNKDDVIPGEATAKRASWTPQGRFG